MSHDINMRVWRGDANGGGLVDYTVPAERYNEFVIAVHKLRDVRLRTGSIRWGIFRDGNDPERLEESFVMESWLDYLRSRERMTAADQEIRAKVTALHVGPETPKISHQVFVREITPQMPGSPDVAAHSAG